MTLPWLDPDTAFPPAERALKEPNGLLAAGADLSPERLVTAYRRGIFPWFEPGQPILWWSPDPRAVLYPDRLRISRSLKKTIRRGHFRWTFNQAFEQVMGGCAAPRRDQEGTWITPIMRRAYAELHRRGIAHSVETWEGEELVGGLYGLAMGRFFFGESMFSRRSDASKTALVFLAEFLRKQGYILIDCQVANDHTVSLGTETMPRTEYLALLERWHDAELPPHWPAPAPVSGVTE